MNLNPLSTEFPNFGRLLSFEDSKNDKDSISAITDEQYLNWLDEHKVLVLRGKADMNEFEKFSNRFCKHFQVHQGKNREIMGNNKHSKSVNLGNQHVEMHAESRFYPMAPDYLFFYCLMAPSEGGETLIADANILWEILPDDVKNIFTSRDVIYRQQWDKSQWSAALDAETIDEACKIMENKGLSNVTPKGGDEISFEFQTSPLTYDKQNKPHFANNILVHWEYLQYMEVFQGKDVAIRHEVFLANPREPVSDELFREIKKATDQVKLPLKWQNGDIVMVDNLTALHGRNSFPKEVERKITLRAGFKK